MPLQFDKHRIAIRERHQSEILDLALAVIRDRGAGLFAALLIGTVPMILLNGWLLQGWVEASDVEDTSPLFSYMYFLLLLTAAEIPLATAPITLYLGHSMFEDRPTARQIWADFCRALPQMFVYQVLLRNIWVAIQLGFIPFVWSPYLNEIILLEKNPFRSKSPRAITTHRRSQSLHDASRGLLMGRWFASLGIGLTLVGAVWLSLWVILSQLAGSWPSHFTVFLVLLPIASWSVVGYFAVVRFLAYLDLRIRHEGWEVELLMRAESARLARLSL